MGQKVSTAHRIALRVSSVGGVELLLVLSRAEPEAHPWRIQQELSSREAN